ncbi:MAG: multiheme c-type cytochrome [Sulfuricaulis sp.]
MRGSCFLLLFLLPLLATAGGKPPTGKFTNAECLGCHASRDAKLIAAWRASSHARTAPKADCVTCHGATHAASLARARRDSACVACHEKLNRTVTHSYATSKHATIVKLEEDQWDWSQPLVRGNYRAPGCAYCHLHGAEHDTRLSVTTWQPFQPEDSSVREPVATRWQAICGECHAPRYVSEQAATGARMQEIARMKLREAREVMTRYQGVLLAENRRELDSLFTGMQAHGRNVRLGVGHQSPDYQWWHGQPALDGDLLRIKGMIAERERQRAGRP